MSALADHQHDEVKDLEEKVKKLEKLALVLFCKALGRDKIEKPYQLVSLAKAKPAERKKQFKALGASEDGLSEDDFDWLCKCAAKVL